MSVVWHMGLIVGRQTARRSVAGCFMRVIKLARE